MKKNSYLCLLTISIFACTTPADLPYDEFLHSIDEGPTPWTHTNFDTSDSSFSFALVSDLYSGGREGVFEVAVEQLNLLRPEFVLSVGDLIDGGTDDPQQLEKEFDIFDGMIEKLNAPFFHVGGNHDLTNPVMRKFWEDRFGLRYYYFLYKNVLFLIMDSEDYTEDRMIEIYEARTGYIELSKQGLTDSVAKSAYYQMEERLTGEISRDQTNYFKEVLKKFPDVRWTFVLMHKPVCMREDDGGLAPLENMLANRPYSVINGHFHSFSHQERLGRDYTILGTTSGIQNAEDPNAFDHISLIHIGDDDAPTVAHLRLEGILDKTGNVPLNGDTLCFQASRCK